MNWSLMSLSLFADKEYHGLGAVEEAINSFLRTCVWDTKYGGA